MKNQFQVFLALMVLSAPLPVSGMAADVVAIGGAELFAVYSGRQVRPGRYVASGYMGDNTLTMSGAYIPTHDGTGTPLKLTFKPNGPKGWSGIYWQNPANNWGERAGSAGYDLRGAKKLVFWARGEKGGEKIHEVRMGGITGRYPDSDVATLGPIKLTTAWQKFELDLTGKDLRHIIGGFGLFVNKYENVGDISFYLDDIAFEMPSSAAPAPVAAAPAPNPASVAMAIPAVAKGLQVKQEDNGLRVSFSSQVLFASGKTILRSESAPLLKQVSDVLKAYPQNDVLIEGHTDNVGSADYNLELSRLRAEHVKDALIKEGGFNVQRFRTVGYGLTHPVTDNATAANRAMNRRVEVIILKTDEKVSQAQPTAPASAPAGAVPQPKIGSGAVPETEHYVPPAD